MTLDIRGSIKNTKLSLNQYVVFEELISNSIDAYLIRRADDTSAPHMKVTIVVNFMTGDLLEDREVMSVSCGDNGCGLGDEQLKAFLTKDTSYKDDLLISGIGKCKGAGRIQFFHHFAAMTIASTYRERDKVLKRELRYAEPQKQIETDDFRIVPGAEADIGTVIRLEQFKEVVDVGCPTATPSAVSSPPGAQKANARSLLAAACRTWRAAGRLRDPVHHTALEGGGASE